MTEPQPTMMTVDELARRWAVSPHVGMLDELASMDLSDTSAAPWMVVYFIRVNAFVKIGYARNPLERLRHVQAASPYPVELMGALPGGTELEERLHRFFDHCRERGEWFRLEPHLRAFVVRRARGDLFRSIAKAAE